MPFERPVSRKSRLLFVPVFAIKIKLSIICATVKQVLSLKFAFGPEKLPGLSRNGLAKLFIVRSVKIVHY